MKMNVSELKVGQTVKHRGGFIGKIEKILPTTIHIRVTDSGKSGVRLGIVYYADLEYVTEIIEDVKPKLTIDVEVLGLEKLQELADKITKTKKENNVFECSLGKDMVFKGTKDEFTAYVAGLIDLMKLGNLFR